MATTTGVGWGKPQAHPNVAVHIDVPTLGFAPLTPTYAGSLLLIPAQAGREVGWGKPQAHPNVAVRIDVPTLGFASLTPTYAGSLLVIPAQAGR